MTMTEHFPWAPEYVLHEFLLESHEKQSNGQSWKKDFVRSRNWSALKFIVSF